MKCPDCGTFISVADRSTRMFPPLEVLRCRTCGTFRFAGDEVAIPGGSGSMDCLRGRASDILSERRAKEMLESDISDPRWERWMQ